MSDIVERLRDLKIPLETISPEDCLTCEEAADLIERQAAEIERLREALTWIMEQGDGHIGPFTSTPQQLSDVARAALKSLNQPHKGPWKHRL